MDIDLIKYFLTFIFLLLLSAFFSGSEVAFFSLNSKYLKQILEKFKLTHKIVTYLLKNPSRLLVTILICNTIVNVSIAIVAVFITLDIIELTSADELLSVFIEVVIVTILLLLFGEITPKITAKKYPVQFSRFAAIPLFIIYSIMLPISKLFELIASYISEYFRVKHTTGQIPTTELKYIIDLIDSKSNIDVHTKYFLKRINEFNRLTAKDVLIPRVKLNAFEIYSSVKEPFSLLNKMKVSYIPIYENNIDNIIGVISIKSILKIRNNSKCDTANIVYQYLEKPLYIPETKKVTELLMEMKKSSMPVAVVIDEHGGVAGLITEDDLLKLFF